MTGFAGGPQRIGNDMAYFDFQSPSLDFLDAQEQDMLQKAAQIKALRQMDLTTKPDQQPGFTSAVTVGQVPRAHREDAAAVRC